MVLVLGVGAGCTSVEGVAYGVNCMMCTAYGV